MGQLERYTLSERIKSYEMRTSIMLVGLITVVQILVIQISDVDGCTFLLPCKNCNCDCRTQGCTCNPKDCNECYSCCNICFSWTCNKMSPKTDYKCLMMGEKEGECYKA